MPTTTGVIALEKLQAGLEVTRGTAVAATKKLYGERGTAWFEGVVSREFLNETYGDYVANHRNINTAVSAKGTIPGYLTAADTAWWGQSAWNSNAPTGPTQTTVYTWTWTPALWGVASDNLKTFTLEAYSDTQPYQLPFCLTDKFEISWQAGKPVMFTADVLAQQWIAQTVTPGLTDRTGVNPLAGTTAKVYIDNSGGTIGNTVYNNVLSGKITWQNKWTPITHNVGNLYYDDAAREPRSVALELDIHFKDTQEFAQLMTGGERLIRIVFTGPAITGSSPSTNESVTIDLWGYYLSAAFGVDKALRTVKLTGQSQFDTSAGFDWRVVVVNALTAALVSP